MKWTHLRTCYGFNMRVWVGGKETIYPARWFFCDPDAEWFPNPHGAEASPWLKDFEINKDWGDDGTLKKLDRGVNPGYPGKCFVGDPQWFITGQLPAAVGQWKDPVLTPCCGHVPGENPDARCPQPPFRPCPWCEEGNGAKKYTITATGGTGVFSGFNGVYTVHAVFDCLYDFVDGSIVIGMGFQDGNYFVTLQAAQEPVVAFYHRSFTTIKCLKPLPAPVLSFQLPITDSPPSLSVSPVL